MVCIIVSNYQCELHKDLVFNERQCIAMHSTQCAIFLYLVFTVQCTRQQLVLYTFYTSS